MDWKNGCDFSLPYFVSPPPQSSSALLFNYNYSNNLDKIPAIEAKKPGVEAKQGVDQKIKKKLSQDQLESMERSFEEEVKLDHDRKMKLSKELGLQPRQIAVWFQNRRARWKAKQLQHLYDTLKQDFDIISKEKHNLQQEVKELRNMLREREAARNEASIGHTNVSGEEAAEESASVGVGICCDNYMLINVENVNQISASSSTPGAPFWWGAELHLPSYPNL